MRTTLNIHDAALAAVGEIARCWRNTAGAMS